MFAINWRQVRDLLAAVVILAAAKTPHADLGKAPPPAGGTVG
jgi:hypothetical protein